MAKLIIVDGYNLIYATDRYRKWRESDLELARVKLIEDLATIKALKEYKVMLVFDAAKTDARNRQHAEILGINVWFTRAGETADQMIERIVFKGGFEGEITVVTSDYSQQKVIFKPGVLRKSARELIADFKSADEDLKSVSKKRGKFILEERLDDALKDALKRITGAHE